METAAGPVVATTTARSYVEWGPIIAGAVLAGSLSFVFLTFGSAIGLSATSPWPNAGLSASVMASIAVFWMLAQHIGSFLAGGYVAGRLRTRWQDASEDEVAFRDGVHGGLVWASGLLVGAILAAAAAVALANAGVQATASLAGSPAAGAAMDSIVDTALRPANLAQPPEAGGEARAEQLRAEVGRLIAGAVVSTGNDQNDITYLAQLVAQRTGVTPQDAEKRVNDAIAAARDGADKARKAAALTGFVTAIGFMFSLAAAWWAARKGGRHRDESIPARFSFSRPSTA